MRVVVPDASALVDYLLDASDAAAAVVTDEDADLHVPELCDIEVAAVLRRAIRLRMITVARAEQALGDYLDLPLRRHVHAPLLSRVLDLRHNFGAYDAAYIALAESLGAALLTHDTRLSRAIAAHLDVELV